jgi:hypothetical protein
MLDLRPNRFNACCLSISIFLHFHLFLGSNFRQGKFKLSTLIAVTITMQTSEEAEKWKPHSAFLRRALVFDASHYLSSYSVAR